MDRLRLLLCERCGAVLPAVDPVDGLLRKLSQLGRFGLSAGENHILATRPRGA